MPREFAGLLDLGVAALTRRVVLKDLKRIALDGVKSTGASLDITVVLVGLAGLELIAPAFPVAIETLDRRDDFLGCNRRQRRGRLGLLAAGRHHSAPRSITSLAFARTSRRKNTASSTFM